jgi:hypothetical protein
VRIDYSLCGVKILDLHICLSASVNVRYVLHTQPLGLYNNKILVGYLFIHLFLYLSLLDYPSHLPHLLLPLHAIPSPPTSILSYLINPTLLMAKGGNHNNARNPAPLE